MKIRLLATATALAGLSLATASCSDLVAGDSLIVQAATGSNTTTLGSESTVDGVTLKGISGTAPCDYRNFVVGDVNQYHPTKVTLAFSGNNGTACTGHKTGAALVAQYHDDLVWLTNYLTSKNVKVIYSAPLCKAPGNQFWANGDPAFRTMESQLATFYRAYGKHVAYSEYAAKQICPNWTYVASYRASDGLHLSSTGAPRYAAALRYESKNVNP